MITNYLKLRDHRRTAQEFLFFDDRDPDAEQRALDQARRLCSSMTNVSVWRRTALSRRLGVAEVGETPDPRQEGGGAPDPFSPSRALREHVAPSASGPSSARSG